MSYQRDIPLNPEDQSLLEDASTLLLFSKSTKPSEANVGAGNSAALQLYPMPVNNHTPSLGPASVALLDENMNIANSRTGSRSPGSTKGIVAAAALAAAATVLLPLKKPNAKNVIEAKDSKTKEYIVSAEKEWPVDDSYIVGPDEGIITCICGFNDDDGFTIQCDHCYRWQHGICYGIKNEKNAPDDFLCNICDPRKIDIKSARKKQQERYKGNKKRGRRGNNSAGELVDFSDIQNVCLRTTSHTEFEKEAFMGDKEVYSTVYLPLKKNYYRDKCVELFIKKKWSDPCVLSSMKVFKPVPTEIKSYSDIFNSGLFSSISRIGVFIKNSCSIGDFIDEYLGEIDFKNNYIQDPRNHYKMWGTPKPKVIFHPEWPIYIDARLSGNITRYLRRSCHPNIELSTMRLNSSDDIRFVLKALRNIDEGEELHIKWDWDLTHPIWKVMNDKCSLDFINKADKYLLVHSIDMILGTCDCACGNNEECCLLKLKKISHLLSLSIKSQTDDECNLNEVLHTTHGNVGKRQTPILNRLAHEAISNAARASEVLLKFNSAKLKFLQDQENSYKNSDMNSISMIRSLRVNDSQPYKFRLVEKYFNKEYNASNSPSVMVIRDPFGYNENEVKDIKKLTIPVELPLPEFSNLLEKRPSKNKKDMAGLTTSTILSVNSDHRSSRKKLSFADYKKKVKPA